MVECFRPAGNNQPCTTTGSRARHHANHMCCALCGYLCLQMSNRTLLQPCSTCLPRPSVSLQFQLDSNQSGCLLAESTLVFKCNISDTHAAALSPVKKCSAGCSSSQTCCGGFCCSSSVKCCGGSECCASTTFTCLPYVLDTSGTSRCCPSAAKCLVGNKDVCCRPGMRCVGGSTCSP